jgi:hypothetical protein
VDLIVSSLLGETRRGVEPALGGTALLKIDVPGRGEQRQPSADHQQPTALP